MSSQVSQNLLSTLQGTAAGTPSSAHADEQRRNDSCPHTVCCVFHNSSRSLGETNASFLVHQRAVKITCATGGTKPALAFRGGLVALGALGPCHVCGVSCPPVLPDHRFFFFPLGLFPKPANETAKAEPPTGLHNSPRRRTTAWTGTVWTGQSPPGDSSASKKGLLLSRYLTQECVSVYLPGSSKT